MIFLFVLLITMGFVIYLSLRHWYRGQCILLHALRKALEQATQSIAMHHYEEVERVLLPFLRYPKAPSAVHIRYSEALRGLKRWDEALHAIKYAHSIYLHDCLVELEWAKVLVDLRQYDEALVHFSICRSMIKGELDTWYIAQALFKTGKIEEAWLWIEPKLKESTQPSFSILAALLLGERGQWDTAISIYQTLVDEGYSHHDVLYGLGEAYRRNGNLKEGEYFFRQLLKQDPTDVEATLGIGQCMTERGFYQKALLFYQTSHAIATGDPRLTHQMAFCALRTERFVEAEWLFAKLLKEPFFVQAHHLCCYGYTLEKQQKWAEAEKVYQNAIQRFPHDPHAYRALAWMYGVGFTVATSQEEGLIYSYHALEQLPDRISREIAGACQARAGHFLAAIRMIEQLLTEETVVESRSRLQAALRSLRKELPLDQRFVLRELVA